MSDGEKIVAALLYKYKETRYTCQAWRFGRMELVKGLSGAVDERGILLFEKWEIICYLQEKLAF